MQGGLAAAQAPHSKSHQAGSLQAFPEEDRQILPWAPKQGILGWHPPLSFGFPVFPNPCSPPPGTGFLQDPLERLSCCTQRAPQPVLQFMGEASLCLTGPDPKVHACLHPDTLICPGTGSSSAASFQTLGEERLAPGASSGMPFKPRPTWLPLSALAKRNRKMNDFS